MHAPVAPLIRVQEMYRGGLFFRTFELKPGAILPGHKHFRDHWNFMYSGRGILTVNGEERERVGANRFFVPKEQKHSFRAIEHTIFDCVFPWLDSMGNVTDLIERATKITGAAAPDDDALAAKLFEELTKQTCGDCQICG